MEAFTPNPLDYSLLGWLYASASKDEKIAIQRGLAAEHEATNFYQCYTKPGYSYEEAPVCVGIVFNNVLQPENAAQWRNWKYSEADILLCHPEAHTWTLSQVNSRNALNQRSTEARTAA